MSVPEDVVGAEALEAEAVEMVAGRADAKVFLTCEHASQRFPESWRLAGADLRLAGTHWAYDLGAAEITRELAAATSAPAVLARFSRLLADPNRAEDSPDLFRARADGLPIELNRDLDADERAARLALHRAYHAAIERSLGATSADIVFAVHTFTPVYEGAVRAVELGVLFDREEALAEAMAAPLRAAGFVVAMNEPYSGRGGLMYSAERHAQRHGARAIELETRQDIATDPARRHQLVATVAGFLQSWEPDSDWTQ